MCAWHAQILTPGCCACVSASDIPYILRNTIWEPCYSEGSCALHCVKRAQHPSCALHLLTHFLTPSLSRLHCNMLTALLHASRCSLPHCSKVAVLGIQPPCHGRGSGHGCGDLGCLRLCLDHWLASLGNWQCPFCGYGQCQVVPTSSFTAMLTSLQGLAMSSGPCLASPAWLF